MKKVAAEKRGGLKTKLRDRMRTVKRRVMEIGLAARQKGPQGEERKKAAYRRLLSATRQIANQAERLIKEITSSRGKVKKLGQQLGEAVTRVRQVIRQTVARIFRGDTQYPEKLASLFEPHTEIIRKGKASKPTEFGKMVQIQESENQIITVYKVFDKRPWTVSFWCRPWNRTSNSSIEYRDWWRPTLRFTQRRMKTSSTRWVCVVWPYPIAAHEARSGSDCNAGLGSKRGNAGAPDARAESACSRDGTDSAAAVITALMESSVGWASV